MRPSALPLCILIALLCQFFPPGPALAAGNFPRSTVRLSDFRGASPQEPFVSPAKAVLRLVVSRKPVPYCFYPEREDALNFLGAYVVETLECGHSVEHFFNPPVESLIAKRRRCAQCEPKLIEFPAQTKAPQRKAA